MLGCTLLVSYVYDNVNINLKHATPTGDALQGTLIHLTSGTMIPLKHGIISEVLVCSETLWRRCKHNPMALRRDVLLMTGYNHLLSTSTLKMNTCPGCCNTSASVCGSFFGPHHTWPTLLPEIPTESRAPQTNRPNPSHQIAPGSLPYDEHQFLHYNKQYQHT